MENKKDKKSRMDALRKVTEELRKIRETPLPKEIFDLVEDYYNSKINKNKKSAKKPGEVENP